MTNIFYNIYIGNSSEWTTIIKKTGDKLYANTFDWYIYESNNLQKNRNKIMNLINDTDIKKKNTLLSRNFLGPTGVYFNIILTLIKHPELKKKIGLKIKFYINLPFIPNLI